MESSVARKNDRQLAVGGNGRSHSAGCGESHKPVKLFALESHILAAIAFVNFETADLRSPPKFGGARPEAVVPRPSKKPKNLGLIWGLGDSIRPNSTH